MFHPDGPTVCELVEQALSSTERGYDLLASKFDLTPFRTPPGLLDAVAPHLGEVDDAVDLCCGTGAVMEVLRPRVRRRLVGVDFSRGMLEVARRKLGEGPELLWGDVRALAFREEFDLATCFGALGHLLPVDRAPFLEGVRRALRPGGRLVLVTSPPPPLTSRAFWLARGFNLLMGVRNALWRPAFVMYYLRFLLPEAVEHLEAHGFRVEVRQGLLPGRYRRLALVSAVRE